MSDESINRDERLCRVCGPECHYFEKLYRGLYRQVWMWLLIWAVGYATVAYRHEIGAFLQSF